MISTTQGMISDSTHGIALNRSTTSFADRLEDGADEFAGVRGQISFKHCLSTADSKS